MRLRPTLVALAVLAGFGSLSCREMPTSPISPRRADFTQVPPPQIVISQIYGGGGNSGATYKNDFIEIFNPGPSAVNVAGWSVQYGSSAGTTWQATALAGSIPSGGYYLVQEAAGSGGTVSLPTPNATGTINMSGTAGKVWLSKTTTLLTGACPTGGTVVDQVSFGTAATNCGFLTTGTLSNTASASRKDSGCSYSNDLSFDFTVGAVAPRNGATATHVCPIVAAVGPLDHVAIAGPATLTVGTSVVVAATPQDVNNATVATATVTWTSSDASIASVDATGKVSGLVANPAPVTITATAVDNGITRSSALSITITNPTITWIDVSSSATTFPPGFQTQVFFTARVAQGGAIIPATFSFESLNPEIATMAVVQNTGIITGVASPADGVTKPGFKVTATPVGGGTPFTFTTHPVTIEAAVSAPLSIYATNDEFGDPTAATASNPVDLLIVRPQYTLSYHEARGTPNWVSYELDARQMVAGQDRCNCFTADPLLPADKQIFTSDYTSGGFDRGHMTRSADRTAGNFDNASTFFLTNVVPQMADLNQGVWAQFENALADSARAGRAVYIITGPIYSRSPLTYVKNEGKIAVPDSTWKIAFIGPRDINGVPFRNVDVASWGDLQNETLLAVNMPNVAGVRNDPWAKYLTTVDRIETSTGYDFLSLLNVGFQGALEAGDRAPTAQFTYTGTLNEGSLLTFDASASSDPDLGRIDLGRPEALSYAWQFSDGTTAAGKIVTKAFSHGAVTATLVVSDAFGWERTAAQTLTLANLPPSASFSAPTTTVEGSALTISLTDAFDPSPTDAASLQFAFDCGTGYASSSSTPTAVCTPPDNGDLTVHGKVIDPAGAFAEYTTVIHVTNALPTATFAWPPTSPEGSSFSLSLSGATDPSAIDATSLQFAFDCGTGSYSAPSSAAAISCPTDDNGTRAVRARVIDKDGGLTEYAGVVSVFDVAPTASFNRPGSVLEGAAIALSLTEPTDVSTADVAAGFTFAFDCGDGQGYSSPTVNATATCPTNDNGSRSVRGKVIDRDGGFSEYTGIVGVANVAPTATFGWPSTLLEGSSFGLTMTGANDVSSIDAASLMFSFDCGTGGYSTPASSSTFDCSTTDNGDRNVRARVIDKDGGVTEYAGTVQVSNVAPTALFNAPASIEEGSAISLSLTGATDVSAIDVAAGFTYAFDCGDGAGYSAPGASPTASCSTTDNGTRAVRGKVFDKDGASTEYAGSVPVSNIAPTALFNAPVAVQEGSAISLSLTGATDVSTVDVAAGFTYAFDCGDGAGYSAAGASPNASCSTTDNGTRAVRGKVFDKDGASTEYDRSVSIANVAPSVTLAATTSTSIVSGGSVTAAGSFADPGSDSPWSYFFNWGTGANTTGSFSTSGASATASRQYLTAGSYTVSFAVTDKAGAVGTAMVTVTVSRRSVSAEVNPKSININGNGNGDIKVTLTSSTIDLSTIDLASVRIGTVGVNRKGNGYQAEGNSRSLSLHFERKALIEAGVLTSATTEITLLANLASGVQITARAAVDVH